MANLAKKITGPAVSAATMLGDTHTPAGGVPFTLDPIAGAFVNAKAIKSVEKTGSVDSAMKEFGKPGAGVKYDMAGGIDGMVGGKSKKKKKGGVKAPKPTYGGSSTKPPSNYGLGTAAAKPKPKPTSTPKKGISMSIGGKSVSGMANTLVKPGFVNVPKKPSFSSSKKPAVKGSTKGTSNAVVKKNPGTVAKKPDMTVSKKDPGTVAKKPPGTVSKKPDMTVATKPDGTVAKPTKPKSPGKTPTKIDPEVTSTSTKGGTVSKGNGKISIDIDNSNTVEGGSSKSSSGITSAFGPAKELVQHARNPGKAYQGDAYKAGLNSVKTENELEAQKELLATQEKYKTDRRNQTWDNVAQLSAFHASNKFNYGAQQAALGRSKGPRKPKRRTLVGANLSTPNTSGKSGSSLADIQEVNETFKHASQIKAPTMSHASSEDYQAHIKNPALSFSPSEFAYGNKKENSKYRQDYYSGQKFNMTTFKDKATHIGNWVAPFVN